MRVAYATTGSVEAWFSLQEWSEEHGLGERIAAAEVEESCYGVALFEVGDRDDRFAEFVRVVQRNRVFWNVELDDASRQD